MEGKREEPSKASNFSFDQLVLARENALLVEKKLSIDSKMHGEEKKIKDVQKKVEPKTSSLPEKKLTGNPKKEDVATPKSEANLVIVKSRSSSLDSSSWEYYTDTEQED